MTKARLLEVAKIVAAELMEISMSEDDVSGTLKNLEGKGITETELKEINICSENFEDYEDEDCDEDYERSWGPDDEDNELESEDAESERPSESDCYTDEGFNEDDSDTFDKEAFEEDEDIKDDDED